LSSTELEYESKGLNIIGKSIIGEDLMRSG